MGDDGSRSDTDKRANFAFPGRSIHFARGMGYNVQNDCVTDWQGSCGAIDES